MRKLIVLFSLILILSGLNSQAFGKDATITNCTDCHNEKGKISPLGPPDKLLATSIHAGLECTYCHTSISVGDISVSRTKPHGENVKPAECSGCHEDETATYKNHGRMEYGKDPDVPACWSCHGTHDILPSSNNQSRVHPLNLPRTCQNCHIDVDLVKRHDVLRDKPMYLYRNSIHGKATRMGIYVAAVCNDCHATTDKNGKRTAHHILSPADPNSPIFHFNIPETCGQCHKPILKDYTEGIHGEYLKRGSIDTPVCTSCHGEHGIISHEDPLSPVSAAHLAEQTCAPCHESPVLIQKYGLPKERLTSYIDSYHGLKSKAGDKAVANCASCHGAHRILAQTNKDSSISLNNLKATCSECHPTISDELAKTPIHKASSGNWPDIFKKLYIILIITVIGAMLIHNISEWLRYVVIQKNKTYVQRLNLNEVMQHWAIMISFIVLVITGFSLRFSDAAWVKWLFGWEGGFELRGTIHRVFAIGLIIWFLWHLIYLLSRRGFGWFKDMLPVKSDFIHAWHNVLFFAGKREHIPKFKRFSYTEKAEYWALIWGTIIMIVTGLCLWFDNSIVKFLNKGILDVMLVIHYYEAWLATLAIVVWHIYGTIFRPSVYPMNPAWIAGKMPAHMYNEEHPDGPELKHESNKLRRENDPAPKLEEPPSHDAP